MKSLILVFKINKLKTEKARTTTATKINKQTNYEKKKKKKKKEWKIRNA